MISAVKATYRNSMSHYFHVYQALIHELKYLETQICQISVPMMSLLSGPDPFKETRLVLCY